MLKMVGDGRCGSGGSNIAAGVPLVQSHRIIYLLLSYVLVIGGVVQHKANVALQESRVKRHFVDEAECGCVALIPEGRV